MVTVVVMWWCGCVVAMAGPPHSPIARNAQALVLPFASSVPWDDCIVWHPVRSANDATQMLRRLQSLALDAAGLRKRQRACAALRNRAAVWRLPGEGGRGGGGGSCAAGTVSSELLQRLHSPHLIEQDWAATLRSLQSARRGPGDHFNVTAHGGDEAATRDARGSSGGRRDSRVGRQHRTSLWSRRHVAAARGAAHARAGS